VIHAQYCYFCEKGPQIMAISSPPQTLTRDLGIFGATMLGLGSIVGTGVFVSIGIAAGAAGPAVLLSIALAAILASCNALSSAQLAAAYPVSGGAYEYGYRLLHPKLGFTAGWMFLCAKSASAATAAVGAAGYALHLAGYNPKAILPWLGFGVSLLLMGLVLSGLRRSNFINIVIVSITVLALSAFAVAGLLNIAAQDVSANFTPVFNEMEKSTLKNILYATALMFVAYTGYGRIATMGEEVQNPRKNIPRAIIATLIVSAGLYMLVAIAAIGATGSDVLSGTAGHSATPLETAARALNVPGLALLIAVGAVTAMLGVLLNLILGLSRVALAMGRRGDLPPAIGRLTQSRSPRSAILFVGLIIAGLALIGDVKTTWSFSAFAVLIYYAIANLAALQLPKEQRLYPRFIAWGGLGGCLYLAFFLPVSIWLTGLGFIMVGLIWQVAAGKIWP
jgi:APA family basic amino acid/polyamine antiporter